MGRPMAKAAYESLSKASGHLAQPPVVQATRLHLHAFCWIGIWDKCQHTNARHSEGLSKGVYMSERCRGAGRINVAAAGAHMYSPNLSRAWED